ncbi:MAG TPA: hypothetical protein VJ796_04765 [Acidimicrobiia bacterium]|nr:hypothetical protein [Acidimicrobiia bacterium]
MFTRKNPGRYVGVGPGLADEVDYRLMVRVQRRARCSSLARPEHEAVHGHTP